MIPLALQVGIALIGFVLLVLAPPARGRILLVPLSSAAAHRLPLAALQSGAALLSPGPVSGSLIVLGDGAQLRAPFSPTELIVMAAPTLECGNLLGPEKS